MTWKKKHLGFQKFDEKYMVSFEFFEKFANHFNFWFVIYIGEKVKRAESALLRKAVSIGNSNRWLADGYVQARRQNERVRLFNGNPADLPISLSTARTITCMIT